MTNDQLATELGCEVTPEPTPVMIAYERCPLHFYHYVSMPRNEGEEYYGLEYKCPIKWCIQGK